MKSSSIRRDIAAVETLKTSRGWKVVSEVMKQEIDVVVRRLSSPAASSREDIDFLRAAIFAAQSLLDLPDKVIQRLTNDLLIAESLESAKDDSDSGR